MLTRVCFSKGPCSERTCLVRPFFCAFVCLVVGSFVGALAGWVGLGGGLVGLGSIGLVSFVCVLVGGWVGGLGLGLSWVAAGGWVGWLDQGADPSRWSLFHGSAEPLREALKRLREISLRGFDGAGPVCRAGVGGGDSCFLHCCCFFLEGGWCGGVLVCALSLVSVVSLGELGPTSEVLGDPPRWVNCACLRLRMTRARGGPALASSFAWKLRSRSVRRGLARSLAV